MRQVNDRLTHNILPGLVYGDPMYEPQMRETTTLDTRIVRSLVETSCVPCLSMGAFSLFEALGAEYTPSLSTAQRDLRFPPTN